MFINTIFRIPHHPCPCGIDAGYAQEPPDNAIRVFETAPAVEVLYVSDTLYWEQPVSLICGIREDDGTESTRGAKREALAGMCVCSGAAPGWRAGYVSARMQSIAN